MKEPTRGHIEYSSVCKKLHRTVAVFPTVGLQTQPLRDWKIETVCVYTYTHVREVVRGGGGGSRLGAE
jgi:hypothetical protein